MADNTYLLILNNFFMRTAFEKHALENEKSAKTALVSLAATVIGKYVITQAYMNSMLSGGSSPDEKTQACLQCKLNTLTKKMAKFEGQVGQIAKSYETMFNEEMDIKFITGEALNEFYPTYLGKSVDFDPESVIAKTFSDGSSNGSSWSKPSSPSSSPSSPKSSSSTPIDFPEGTPDSVKDVANLIKETIAKVNGGNLDVRVVDITGKDTMFFGVNPNDFSDAKSFQKAVIAAKEAHYSESGTTAFRNGEEWLKEAAIQAIEDSVNYPEEPTTPSSSKPSSPKDPKSKLN